MGLPLQKLTLQLQQETVLPHNKYHHLVIFRKSSLTPVEWTIGLLGEFALCRSSLKGQFCELKGYYVNGEIQA